MFPLQEQYFMGVVKFISLDSRGLHGSNQARLEVYSQHPGSNRGYPRCHNEHTASVYRSRTQCWVSEPTLKVKKKVNWKGFFPFSKQVGGGRAGRQAGRRGHITVIAFSLIPLPQAGQEEGRGVTLCACHCRDEGRLLVCWRHPL